jgi:hypothetical protein
MKDRRFLITPQNEGQELNYIEEFMGTPRNAKWRAKTIADGLQMILRQGDISVKVEDSKTLKEIAWIKARKVI